MHNQPVSIPRTTPCCSGSAFLLTIALMAGYMILADAASIPATHISLAEREGGREREGERLFKLFYTHFQACIV